MNDFDKARKNGGFAIARKWLWWSIFCACLVAYHWATGVASRSYESPLMLKPGTSINVNVVSLLGHRVHIDVLFPRNGSERRTDTLGEWRTKKSADGALIFNNPGAGVEFSASVNGGNRMRLEAMPASGYGTHYIIRSLSEQIPADRHQWYLPLSPPQLDVVRGSNLLSLTVVNVDPALRGERVSVLIQPPYGWVSVQDRYFFLLALLPVYLAGLPALAIWTVLLVRRTARPAIQRFISPSDM